MNIFQRISKAVNFDLGGEKRIQQLAILFNTVFARYGSMFAGRTAKQRTALEVSAKGLVFTCIDKYTKAELAVPIFIKLRTNQKDSVLAPVSHKAVTLFENPNPIYSILEIRSMVDKWVMINGNIFLFTPDYDTNFPLQMWILDPTKMRIVMGSGDNLITGYEYQGFGGVMFFPEKLICHIRTLEPSTTYERQLTGTGIVEAALDSAIVDAEASEFVKRYYANDARPPQILRDEDNLLSDETAKKIFLDDWKKKLPNNQLAARLMGGMKVESLQGSATDMNIVEINKLTRQGITEVFGVPLVMIEGTYGSRATAQVVETYFHTGAVNPFMRVIDSALTKHFRQWDENIIIEHEYYVDHDAEEIRLQETHELATGQTTINELLKAKNKPSIGAAGDTRFVPNNYVPLDKAIAPTPPAAFGARDLPEKKKFNLQIRATDEKLIFWRSFDSLTQKKADTLKGEISAVFADLEREIIGNVGKNFAAYRDFILNNNDVAEIENIRESIELTSYSQIVKSDLIQVAELFSEDEWVRKLEAATGETLTALQKVALLESLKAIGENMDSLPSDFSELMKSELSKSSAKITESIGTIREEVRNLLADNTDATAAELKELLTAKFETLKVSRAETIARTSANHTTNAAQSTTWGAYEIDMVWLTQRDGDVRATHLAADGQKRDENGMYNVGGDVMPYPCGGGIAGENVNCRCMQFPERKKK